MRWSVSFSGLALAALMASGIADAIVVTKGMPQSGDGIRTFFSGLKSKGWEDHKTTVTTALPKDNLLILSGRWEMSGPAEGGTKKKFSASTDSSEDAAAGA